MDSASPPAEAAAIRKLAAAAGARLLRTDQPGLSLARNLGLAEAGASWVAFLDDDAVPEPGWAAALLNRIARLPERAAALGGRILPAWEAPLPGWWPPSLRGVLTIIEWEGFGEVGADLPDSIEIYGANMAFAVGPLREVGGFAESLGRVGNRLLSGEEVEVVASLRARGYRAFYEGAAAVRHSIQRDRLRPGWLLSRLLWQGATDALRDRSGNNGHGRLARRRGAAARAGAAAALARRLAGFPAGPVRRRLQSRLPARPFRGSLRNASPHPSRRALGGRPGLRHGAAPADAVERPAP